ncbi:MAG: ABC transporter permease [Rhodospirillales bacterium]|nr:ABC transporter permease [Rhodospirillales bacterium]
MRDHPPVPRAILFSWGRIGAMLLRHFYVMRRSWTRLFELAYWPTAQMVLWGFITVFSMQRSSWVARASGVLLSAALLWDTLFRSNFGVSVSFLEELWARTLGQLFVSPLRVHELLISLLIMSGIRTIIGIVPAAILAIQLYGVSLFDLGLPLIAFFTNLLVMGWAIGLFSAGLVLRYGLAAESFCWGVVFLLAPLSGVYYPLDTLPVWLQPVALTLPSTYVFEGMRAVLFDHTFRLDLLAGAVGLNIFYLAVTWIFFLWIFRIALIRGLLMQQCE